MSFGMSENLKSFLRRKTLHWDEQTQFYGQGIKTISFGLEEVITEFLERWDFEVSDPKYSIEGAHPVSALYPERGIYYPAFYLDWKDLESPDVEGRIEVFILAVDYENAKMKIKVVVEEGQKFTMTLPFSPFSL